MIAGVDPMIAPKRLRTDKGDDRAALAAAQMQARALRRSPS